MHGPCCWVRARACGWKKKLVLKWPQSRVAILYLPVSNSKNKAKQCVCSSLLLLPSSCTFSFVLVGWNLVPRLKVFYANWSLASSLLITGMKIERIYRQPIYQALSCLGNGNGINQYTDSPSFYSTMVRCSEFVELTKSFVFVNSGH